jgi:sensor histidine kinase regulating citrate/malate metabolism
MKEIINILRINRHDMANHLNTILMIARLNQPGALVKIEEYIKGLSENMEYSCRSFCTGNEYIDGLLGVKFNHTHGKGIKLIVDFEAKLNLIEIGNHELISIISNIVDNAIEALESDVNNSDKYISISGYVDDKEYILIIYNNGPAIPKQDYIRIFESGFSSKNARERGFGLCITRQNVIKNKGKITVSSSEDGTEFTIAFPLKQVVSIL